jgi:hypothetical protein
MSQFFPHVLRIRKSVLGFRIFFMVSVLQALLSTVFLLLLSLITHSRQCCGSGWGLIWNFFGRIRNNKSGADLSQILFVLQFKQCFFKSCQIRCLLYFLRKAYTLKPLKVLLCWLSFVVRS